MAKWKGQAMTNEDERIAAYLDGEMTAEDRAAFEQQMAHDPHLADKIGRWRNNDTFLRQALPTEALPDELLTRMGLSDLSTMTPQAMPVAANDNPPWKRWRWPAGGALAASLAALLWWQIPSDNALADDPAFQIALESGVSGTSVQIEEGRSVTPVLSFVSGKGNYCREFAVGNGASGQSGIACRAAGGWQVEALVKGNALSGNNGGYQTAGGADTRALDSTYQRLGAGDPLTAVKEKDLITNGWSESAK